MLSGNAILIFALLIVAGLFVITQKGRRKREREQECRTPVVGAPLSEGHYSNSAERRYIKAAVEARSREEDVRTRAYDDHQKRIGAARKKLEKADKLIKESGLASALTAVMETMWTWPHWLSRQGNTWKPPDDITDINGGDRRNPLPQVIARDVSEHDDVDWVTWRWRNIHWLIYRSKHSPYAGDDDLYWGKMSLWVNGEEVVKVFASLPMADPDMGADWEIGSADILSIGPWLADFIRFAGYLGRIEDEERYRSEEKDVYDRADRIKF